MYDLPAQTLYTYLNNPLLDKFSFAQVPVSSLAKEIESYQNKTKQMPTPEEQALMFYMTNHGFHLIKSKYNEFEVLPPLAAELVESHMKITNDIARRLFYYIVLISVEEAHCMQQQGDHFYNYMGQNFGPDFGEYTKGHFSGSLTSFKKLSMSTGPFLRGMRSVFDFGKWQGGYGGKPWGNIVGLASNVAFGRESFEMMADYAFSLCHNNGSMFNKGKLYSYYTSFIYDILDIQASGQIPNWIGENKNNKFVTPEIKALYDKFAKLFPQEFTAPLNKAKVQSSGKIRRDNEQKHMQVLKAANPGYGSSGSTPTPPEPPKQKIDNILIGTFQKNKWI